MTDNTHSELLAALIAKADYWGREGQYLDIAKTVADEVTVEYATNCVETEDLLHRAADALESFPPVADEALRKLLAEADAISHDPLAGRTSRAMIIRLTEALRSILPPPVDTERVTDALAKASAWLLTMTSHTECCGVPQMRALMDAMSRISTSARDEALEEAAKVAEAHKQFGIGVCACQNIADDIRALSSPHPIEG